MTNITIRANDGFEFGAWRADPSGTPRGAIVVIQEIFGVNSHIRAVADGYAADGWVAIAPQIFDRVEANVELGYEADDMQRGIAIAMGQLDRERALTDVQATIDVAAAIGPAGVVGYCFGGLLTWLAACECTGVGAAVAYYGGGIAGTLDRTPKCPVQMHFGERDAHISLADVDRIRQAHPEVDVHVYAADHGFNCDQRASHDAPAAKAARERAVAFFREHLKA